MAPRYPIPRAEVPQLQVDAQEHALRRQQAQTLLISTVQAYEHMRTSAGVDARRWKQVEGKDGLKLYQQRSAWHSAGPVAVATERQRETENTTPSSDNSTFVDIGDWFATAMNSQGSDLRPSPPTFVTGTCLGNVGNVLHAVITESPADWSLLTQYLHSDIADCALLATLERPKRAERDADHPFHLLAYEWMVHRPSSYPLGHHRNSVLLTAAGQTQTTWGESLGFFLANSVDLELERGVPNGSSKVKARARAMGDHRYRPTVCCLFRQVDPHSLQVFILATAHVPKSKRLASNVLVSSETLFSLARLSRCGEIRRLTELAEAHRMDVQGMAATTDRNQRNKSCNVCQESLAFAPRRSVCHVCGQIVCAKCRAYRQLYVRESEVLGKFYKVHCCKQCIVTATSTLETAFSYVSDETMFRSLNERGQSREASLLRPSSSASLYGAATPASVSSSTSRGVISLDLATSIKPTARRQQPQSTQSSMTSEADGLQSSSSSSSAYRASMSHSYYASEDESVELYDDTASATMALAKWSPMARPAPQNNRAIDTRSNPQHVYNTMLLLRDQAERTFNQLQRNGHTTQEFLPIASCYATE